MPRFLEAIADSDKGPESTSIIMVDNRHDERMVSPFQAWLVSEIMANSASSINVLTERDQVMPPSSGFHLALFANYTLDGIKAVMAISIESETGSDCAGWDGETASALAHPAFQPFTWPMIRDTSASYADVKAYNGNEILFHWILRGFRSDTDLTVQQQFVDEYLVREVNKGKPRLSVVVAVFMAGGSQCSAMNVEVRHILSDRKDRWSQVTQPDRGSSSEYVRDPQRMRWATMQIASNSGSEMQTIGLTSSALALQCQARGSPCRTSQDPP